LRTPKVQVLIRVRLRSGQYAYAKPARNRNRTLGQGYALVDGDKRQITPIRIAGEDREQLSLLLTHLTRFQSQLGAGFRVPG
jgi:hypothetical protein